MCTSVLPACVCAPHAFLISAEARRGLDPLKLEYQIVINYHMGMEPGSSAKAASSLPLSHLSSAPVLTIVNKSQYKC